MEWGHFWNKGPVGKISGGTISGQVDNDGTITGGTFTGTVNNSGAITGGDFKNATVNNGGGTVTGGTFSNFTMDSETGALTITGNVDLSANPNALAPLTIALTDDSIKSVAVEKDATFNAGSNAVSAGVTNEGTITGGAFDDALKNTGTVTGCQINGPIDNSGTIRGCTFGDAAKVEENTGTIYVTMTVNGLDVTTFKHGENILSALETTFGKGKWYAVVGEEQAEISNTDTFGLQKQTYACAYYTEDTTLYITAPTSVTEEMLAGVNLVIVMETGEIKGGTFTCRVYNMGAISGGTFEGRVDNYGTPCFTGVFVPACASLARYSGAADALWACPRPSTPSGLRRAYFALLRAQRARFVRPLWERGAFWIVALPYEAALPKSLLSPRGAFWIVVRCREQHCPKAVL